MGAAVSTNVAKTMATVISNVTNSVIQNQIANIDQNQSIIIRDVDGDVLINNVVQKISATVNTQALFASMADADIKQTLSFELAQAAKSLIKDINFGNISVASNDIEAVISETVNISTNLNQTCSSKVTANQNILIEKDTGNVTLQNTTQEAIASQVLSCALNAISQSKAVNDLQAKIDQKASATTAGVSIWGLATIAGIIVLGLAVVFVGPVIVPFIAAGKKPQIIGILVALIGGIFLLLWGFWTSRDVSVTLWAAPLAEKCPNIVSLGKINVSTAEEAARKCIETKNAIAFDFVASQKIDNVWQNLTQPYVELFSKVDKTCLKDIKIDDSPILSSRNVFVATTSAPTNFGQKISIGDVWINASNAIFQICNQLGSNLVWTPPKLLDSRVTSLTSVDIPNVKFVDFSNNQNGFQLSSDSSLLNFSVKTPSDTIIKFQGPGYVVDRNIKPNTTGKIIKQYKMWALYTGIGLVVVGILLAVFLRPKTNLKNIKDEKNNKELKNEKTN
jgi:hypothetical protein